MIQLDIHTNRLNAAMYSANDKINEFRHNYYQLNPRFQQLQIYAEQIYSLKQIITVLQAIQNKTDLQQNVIYSHKIENGYLQNTPIMRIFPKNSQPLLTTLTPKSHTRQTGRQQTTHSDDGPATYNPTGINYRQTTLRNELPSTNSTLKTKLLWKSQTLQRTKPHNYRTTTATITDPTSIKSTSQAVLFNQTSKPKSPTSKETTNIPRTRETTSQIVLFSTRPALYTIPLQDVQTTQLTKVQTHTPLPYQTIKTILTNLMASFTHFINQAHFLYNAVHIVVSSRLQHATEMITKLCERG